MPSQSPFQINIPATDLLTYLFPSSQPASDVTIWIDADDPSNALSPRDLLLWVKRLGAGLQGLGLKKQDVVLLYSHNHIFVPVAYLGISGCGCIFSGCNPAYGVDETVYQIQNTEAKAILVEPSLLPTLLKAASKVKFPKDRIYLFSDKEADTWDHGVRDWRSFLPSASEAHAWNWVSLDARQSRTTIAALNYSSGTTGLPKGVMISHQNVIANVEQSIYMRNLEQPYQPDSRPQERWLGFLPLYHAYGQLWSIVAAARTLSPCYFMRSFNYVKFLENIQKHRVTHIQTAPPVLVMLAKRPETKEYDLSSLKNILCGAAPLSKELQNEVSTKCDLKVVQTWGMTEVTCSCLHVPGGRDDRSGSVGYIDPNATIKLIDDEGKEVNPGERGEIHVKGPNVCLGYWRNAQATRESFDEDGFLKTGDIAITDRNGLYWIVDRKKELIKVKGFQVAPAELEALLLEHEHVADAAVCALQLEYEELPRAYIVLKSEHREASTEWDIERWMSDRVAKHKQLSGGVVFIQEVPKSPSGKIQRKVLREWAKEDAQGWNKKKEGAKL
ncbi:acetyl-CoA synthetase-like protein [Lindgomyces ingoldianus]|uniref:Acetyl-CoA synthetase-like protein n=1 Tax=Lindgomyces ingoldianus TaxID=673940 RepID=A0ACB6QNQ2_9PLEO|nr:acetyl-CoA synthetase-like protein [Lindgomyces ingoldianus]KAF2467781.1 acetyl-CoA synthetase-like protein [Lindgomyces ingoldianus]